MKDGKFTQEEAQLLYDALKEAVEKYGKPGGPWNVPGEPGSWLFKAKAALRKAAADPEDELRAQFVEKVATVPPDHYAVFNGEDWGIFPKRYCRGAHIIKCHVCGKPATHIDPYFPYLVDLNLCDEHWREREGSEQPFRRKQEKTDHGA